MAKAFPLCEMNHLDIETDEMWGNMPWPKNRKRNIKNGNSQTVGFKAIKRVEMLRPTNTKAPMDRALKISLEVPAKTINRAEAKVPAI